MPQISAIALPDAVTREYLLHHRVCPLELQPNGTLTVAIAPEALLDALDELAMVSRRVLFRIGRRP